MPQLGTGGHQWIHLRSSHLIPVIISSSTNQEEEDSITANEAELMEVKVNTIIIIISLTHLAVVVTDLVPDMEAAGVVAVIMVILDMTRRRRSITRKEDLIIITLRTNTESINDLVVGNLITEAALLLQVVVMEVVTIWEEDPRTLDLIMVHLAVNT
jgi:hypothetical protein